MNVIPRRRPARLAEVAFVFLRLGVVAFGGPAAHIAMMEEETVRRRAWLPREQFLDFLGAAQLVPGPNSSKLAMHLGYRRAGPAGLVAAGVGFILPAMAVVLGKHLAPASLVDAPTIVGALCCTVLLLRFRVNSIWLILGGVGFGLVRAFATF